MISSKNPHEVWQQLKENYEPRDENAYADLETKLCAV